VECREIEIGRISTTPPPHTPCPLMNLLTYKMATININGIHSTTITKLLEDFLHINEIDVLCMQEVTTTTVKMIRNYTARVNIGIEGRGTAILHKDCNPFIDIEKLPNG
jgi:hypothetical protein